MTENSGDWDLEDVERCVCVCVIYIYTPLLNNYRLLLHIYFKIFIYKQKRKIESRVSYHCRPAPHNDIGSIHSTRNTV